MNSLCSSQTVPRPPKRSNSFNVAQTIAPPPTIRVSGQTLTSERPRTGLVRSTSFASFLPPANKTPPALEMMLPGNSCSLKRKKELRSASLSNLLMKQPRNNDYNNHHHHNKNKNGSVDVENIDTDDGESEFGDDKKWFSSQISLTNTIRASPYHQSALTNKLFVKSCSCGNQVQQGVSANVLD